MLWVNDKRPHVVEINLSLPTMQFQNIQFKIQRINLAFEICDYGQNYF